MTETTKPRLKFGYNRGIPDHAKAAWGCRAIWDGSGLPDVVYDRQDADGDQATKQALLTHLNDKVKVRWAERVRDEASMLGLSPWQAQEATVYEDEWIVVKANSNASHGYLYVVAYFKEGVTA
jgi:hypothetical protein